MLVKKINNTNDEDFIENIRGLFDNKLDKKINNTNVDKTINNTNDEYFIENIKDLFNNKLDKKLIIIILMMILKKILEIYLVYLIMNQY